jgi:hypothetical protein
MTKTMKKILMTASCLTIVMAAVPAMANPSVLCSVRANYDAAAGDAAYVPGVDATGKPVVSADVSEPMAVPALKQTLRSPLDIDLAQRLNEVMPEGAKLEANMGLVEVSPDGKVVINGKDLTAPTTAMCNNIEKQKAAALKTKDAPKVVKKKAVVKPVEPVAPVAAETPAVTAPAVEAAPAPEVAAPEPAPQVLQPTAPEAAPAVAPTPAPEAAAPVAPAPAPEAAPAAPTMPAPAIAAPQMGGAVEPAPALTAPAEAGIVSPTEGGMIPRPPVDPLSGQPEPTPPAPAPMNNDANGGMLSGGAQ